MPCWWQPCSLCHAAKVPCWLRVRGRIAPADGCGGCLLHELVCSGCPCCGSAPAACAARRQSSRVFGNRVQLSRAACERAPCRLEGDQVDWPERLPGDTAPACVAAEARAHLAACTACLGSCGSARSCLPAPLPHSPPAARAAMPHAGGHEPDERGQPHRRGRIPPRRQRGDGAAPGRPGRAVLTHGPPLSQRGARRARHACGGGRRPPACVMMRRPHGGDAMPTSCVAPSRAEKQHPASARPAVVALPRPTFPCLPRPSLAAQLRRSCLSHFPSCPTSIPLPCPPPRWSRT